MRLYFLGNCQTNALQAITKDVTNIRPEFGSITEYWGPYNLEKTEEALQSAEAVIAMAVLNQDHPFSADKLRTRLGDRLILIPYIYVDGLASLEKISSKGTSIICGADELKRSELWPHKTKLLNAFIRGEIDMRVTERFSESLTRIADTEVKWCDVVISDYINETYRDKPLLYAINHPTQHVLFELWSRVAVALNIVPDQARFNDPITWAKRALGAADRSLTPYDVSAHGLNFRENDHWFGQAARLIHLAVEKSQNAN